LIDGGFAAVKDGSDIQAGGEVKTEPPANYLKADRRPLIAD